MPIAVDAEILLRHCWTEAIAFMEGSDLARDFLGRPLPAHPRYRPCPSVPLPTRTDLAAIAGAAADSSRALVAASVAAAPFLHWRQSYSEADVGSDFLARSGWCDLAGPEGPLVVDGCRVFLGCWGAGLDYPPHWHAAEELYLPIAGDGLFTAEGRQPRRAVPGDAVFHASNQRHATRMGPEGFLALILWRGDDLAVDIGIEPIAKA